MSGKVTKSAMERFTALVQPKPNTGCWLWVGAMSPNGYGQIWNGERVVPAHRFSYTLGISQAEEGIVSGPWMEPDKRCESRTGGGRYQCQRMAGHRGPHLNGGTEWRDADNAEQLRSEATPNHQSPTEDTP